MEYNKHLLSEKAENLGMRGYELPRYGLCREKTKFD